MTSRRPYWCPKTTKRRPCWCPKPVLWELNSFLMQTLSFVPINLHRCWPREWKHSIFGLVFFALRFLLGVERQRSREKKNAILSLKPLSQVRILVYRRWAIGYCPLHRKRNKTHANAKYQSLSDITVSAETSWALSLSKILLVKKT